MNAALRRVGGVVTQRIANPCTPVRFRYSPPPYFVGFDGDIGPNSELQNPWFTGWFTIGARNRPLDAGRGGPRRRMKWAAPGTNWRASEPDCTPTTSPGSPIAARRYLLRVALWIDAKLGAWPNSAMNETSPLPRAEKTSAQAQKHPAPPPGRIVRRRALSKGHCVKTGTGHSREHRQTAAKRDKAAVRVAALNVRFHASRQ